MRRSLRESRQKVARDADAAAEVSLERFRAQMASQLEAGLSEGRAALASEFQSALESYRSKREAHQKDWAASLDQLTGEAAERYQERLETTCDTWMVASVRRLNEHGQDVIDSLMRSADQALRESCTRVFEGLTDILRGRIAGSRRRGGFRRASEPRNTGRAARFAVKTIRVAPDRCGSRDDINPCVAACCVISLLLSHNFPH